MHQAGRSQMHQVVPGHVLVKPDVLQTSPAPWGSGEGSWEGAQTNQSAGYHMTLDMSKCQQSEPSTSATNGKSLRSVASEMGFQPLMKQKLIQMEFTEVKRWYA